MGQLISAFVPFKPYKWLQALSFICLGMVTITIIFNNDMVNITYAFIGLLLIVMIAYDGPMLHKFSATVILYLFVPSFNYILDYTLFYPGFIRRDMSTNTTTLVNYGMSFLRVLLIVLLWYTMHRLFFPRIKTLQNYASARVWGLLDIISYGSLLLTGYIIVTTDNSMQFISTFIILISLLTEIGILYLTAYMAESCHMAVENENLKSQQQYYEELEQNQLEIRELRHDMNHHLGTIGTYLEENRISEAKLYFEELSETVRGTGRIFCKNGLVNAVINSKYNQAQSLQVDTFFHIDIDEAISLSDVELCSLFANTLDNALEACRNISEPSHRHMELKTRCKNGFFSYQISNSYGGLLKRKVGKYLSTKEQSKEHGLGLERVNDIAKKYDGTLDITAKHQVFPLTFIIPI